VLLTAALAAKLVGSVVVLDPDQKAASARLVTSDGRAQPLHRLPGNRFYAVPRLEGTVEVRCRNGEAGLGGYVTPHVATRVSIQPGDGCRLIEIS
jgi:hypothetical protein